MDPITATLTQLRGSLPTARANARTVAALTQNPGCARRRVIDAAGISAHALAERLGHGGARGQSPFAITSGNQFERRLKEGSGYALLVEALAPLVALPAEPRVVDLGKDRGYPRGEEGLRRRVKDTEEVLAAIARGAPEAPHLVDHPVLTFDVAGAPVFLEPDALAFRIGSELELVEIKSYAVIDGQADPGKLASTSGQSAVYILAIQATLARLGLDPALLRKSVILVAPRNFGRAPTAHRIPLQKKLAALGRVLRAAPRTGAVLDGLDLPAGFTLDVAAGASRDDAATRAALDSAVRRLPMLFVPDCLSSSCDLSVYCRHQAIVDDEPSRLGRAARDGLAGVPRLADALRLAREGARPDEPHLQDIADALRSAQGALERARELAAQPPAPPPPPAPKAPAKKRGAR